MNNEKTILSEYLLNDFLNCFISNFLALLLMKINVFNIFNTVKIFQIFTSHRLKVV